MKRLVLLFLFIIPMNAKGEVTDATTKQKIIQNLAKRLVTQEQRIFRSIQTEPYTSTKNTKLIKETCLERPLDIRRAPSPLGQRQAIS